MTDKQKAYIEYIEDFSGVKFTGNPNSNADISAYIKQNKELADLASTPSWILRNGYF